MMTDSRIQQGVFITGTDTEVGKTVVSCALLEWLAEQGYSTAAMKPVASGASYIDQEWKNEDALALQKNISIQALYRDINPYAFEPPIAPHLAARQAGLEIEFATIKSHYQLLSSQADVTVVEGVGGWLVPLNEKQTLADLAVYLGLPVILVVGIRLGCLNHALLTAKSIEEKGGRLLGWVANIIEPDFAYQQDNIATLKQWIPSPLIAVNQYQGEAEWNTPVLQSAFASAD